MEMENWICIFVAEVCSPGDYSATPGARRSTVETRRIRVKPRQPYIAPILLWGQCRSQSPAKRVAVPIVLYRA